MKKILFGLLDILGTIIIICLPVIISGIVIVTGILTYLSYKLIKNPKKA